MVSSSAILLLLFLLSSFTCSYYYYPILLLDNIIYSYKIVLPSVVLVLLVSVIWISSSGSISRRMMRSKGIINGKRVDKEEEEEEEEESTRRRRSRQGGVLPPGRQGFPFVGETLRLIAAYKTEDPEPFIDERVRMYGSRIFTSHVFGETTVFSADPEFNRMVVGGEGKTFECSYPSSISTLLGKHSLVLMKGSLHKRMHSLTLTRFASLSLLRHSLLLDIDRLVRITLQDWTDGQPLLLLDQSKKITFQLTVKQLISYNPGEWTEALRREYLLLIDGFFSIPFPFPSLLTFTTYGRAIQARKKVAETLREVVRTRKEEKRRNNIITEVEEKEAAAKHTHNENNISDKSMNSNSRSNSSFGSNNINNTKSKKKADDMLDELIDAEEGFTEEEMVDFLLALLVAGYETTPTIMTLVVKFITETPAALALLKEEHDEIRSRKKHESEPLEWSDYKAMRFTQCVINETLRVANIISGVFRRAITDIHFKGYKIPKGCKVFASFRAVHLDPENFKDARTFNPWRWQRSSENGIFTPFGGGPRLCPGYELARVEISIFLHHLVTRFRTGWFSFPPLGLSKATPSLFNTGKLPETAGAIFIFVYVCLESTQSVSLSVSGLVKLMLDIASLSYNLCNLLFPKDVSNIYIHQS